MNILLITADQWRGGYLSCLGHPAADTPSLDRLASEGTVFTRHFTQATPCSPARTSLHTGTYMFTHRCVGNGTPFSSRFTNWALEVRKAGYAPSLFGYTDTASDPDTMSRNDPRLTHYSEPLPGIEDYTPMRDEVSEDWVASLIRKGYDIPGYWWDLNGIRVPGKTWCEGGDAILPLAIAAEDYETRFMTDRCMDWIAAQTRPWVTHLSLLRPHPPFVAPAPYHDMYADADIPDPVRLPRAADHAAQHPYLDYMLSTRSFACPDDDRLLRERHINYLGLIREVDDNLGRLFEFLRSSGQWDDTLVIFTTDHGEQLGDHWLMSKSGFYDASAHIPLIVRDPRSSADGARGSRVAAFTEAVDIVPTMLSWLGREVPAQCSGRSLLDGLERGFDDIGWRDQAFWEYDFRDIMQQVPETRLGLNSAQCQLSVLRTEQYKYVHFPALPPLLFDLVEDPGELVNRADDPGYRDIRLEMIDRMLCHRELYAEPAFTHSLLTAEGPVTRGPGGLT